MVIWQSHAAVLALVAGLCAGMAAPVCAQATNRDVPYVMLPAGTLKSVLASDADKGPMPVAAFAMRVLPVTQGEFLRFVSKQPQWQRQNVAMTFADASYLQDWQASTSLIDDSSGPRPVVNVSWFAAQAFCESEGGRLPTWLEWEYAAAADATRTDARNDPQWLARILGWYARPASTAPAPVGGERNVYGVRDLHGLVWEWVDDFNSLLVSVDSRAQGDPDKLQFCGAGAISLQDRENYAVLMRIALLSSLKASDSTSSLGFRCVRETQ
jgi:formylglycine-generating enzyme required for sulfatase activity